MADLPRFLIDPRDLDNEHFPEPGDFARAVDLTAGSEAARARWAASSERASARGGQDGGVRRINATPFTWTDPSKLAMRAWLYGDHFIRRFVSVTVSPGGVGKSSLEIAEALAMASGKALLGVEPRGRFRVWIWNGEDPLEEMERRVMAAAIHFGLTREDLDGYLFLDSGRDSRLVIANQDARGVKIAAPVVEEVKATIRENEIDVLIIDPFVRSHRVTENDNNAIDAVANEWADIADACECSVELVHHSKKTGGAEVTVEDSRGGSALISAARSARVLNGMTEPEAARTGVERRRLHFRVDNGKASMAPPPEGSTWYMLKGVPLGNGPMGTEGDVVGVVTAWKWPDATAGVTVRDLLAVQKVVAAARWRQDVQAKAWVGLAVAKALDLDVNDKMHRARIGALLRMWTDSGALQVVEGKDEKSRPRRFIEVGEWAND